jgi:hypothetical protein
MKFRTVALALALACGFGTLAIAKQKPVVHKTAKKAKKHKAPKRPKVKHVQHA